MLLLLFGKIEGIKGEGLKFCPKGLKLFWFGLNNPDCYWIGLFCCPKILKEFGNMFWFGPWVLIKGNEGFCWFKKKLLLLSPLNKIELV
jgi:hypothetical protein